MTKRRWQRPGLSRKRGAEAVASLAQSSKGASTGGSDLPDFELAPLASVPPCSLQSKQGHGHEREIDELMLGLALIFDDLKDFLWFWGRLGPGMQYYPEGLGPERGQISGMSLRMLRSIVATLHELLVLLEAKKHVVGYDRMDQMLCVLSTESRGEWLQLNEYARGSKTGRPTAGSIGELLKRVRDKTGSHYDIAKLRAGFEAHFDSSSTEPGRQRAYYADGNNMERTRYFFADAAAEGVFRAELGLSREEFSALVSDHIEHVNNTLKVVISAWLHARGGVIRGTAG